MGPRVETANVGWNTMCFITGVGNRDDGRERGNDTHRCSVEDVMKRGGGLCDGQRKKSKGRSVSDRGPAGVSVQICCDAYGPSDESVLASTEEKSKCSTAIERLYRLGMVV